MFTAPTSVDATVSSPGIEPEGPKRAIYSRARLHSGLSARGRRRSRTRPRRASRFRDGRRHRRHPHLPKINVRLRGRINTKMSNARPQENRTRDVRAGQADRATGGIRTRSLSSLSRALYHFATVATCRGRDSNPHWMASQTTAATSWATATSCRRRDSNPHYAGFESATATSWATPTKRVNAERRLRQSA